MTDYLLHLHQKLILRRGNVSASLHLYVFNSLIGILRPYLRRRIAKLHHIYSEESFLKELEELDTALAGSSLNVTSPSSVAASHVS